MASICNDERASFGVMSGHDRLTLSLSALVASVGRIDIDSSAVNAQVERQPSVGGRLVLEVNAWHIYELCSHVKWNGQMPASRASLPIASGIPPILPTLPGRSPSRHVPSRRMTCA
jgi:hypothetical protein